MSRKLNNWIESYVTYMRTSEAPENFYRWSALWMLSSAIERKAWLENYHNTFYPQLWVILTGPPATFKSTVCRQAVELLKESTEVKIGPNISTVEHLLELLPECNKKFFHENKEYEHMSMAVSSHEWVNLTRVQDLHQCNILGEIYDSSDSIDKGTKTQGTNKIKNYYTTLIGGTTPELIIKCIPDAAIDTGFASRHIFVVQDVAKDRRRGMGRLSKGEKKLREQLTNDLNKIHHYCKGEFDTSDGYAEAFDKWWLEATEIGSSTDSKFDNYYGRKHAHLFSLSMLYSAARNNEMILEEEDFHNSMNILNDAELRMPEAFSGFGKSKLAPAIATIKKILRTQPGGQIKKWELMDKYWRDYDGEIIDRALSHMINIRAIKFEPEDGMISLRYEKWDDGSFVTTEISFEDIVGKVEDK